MEKCCGTCKYHGYDREEKEWYCNCESAEPYGLVTDYEDYCENFQDRENYD